METPGKYILTKQHQEGYFFLIREAQREYDQLEGQWAVIGKYHQRLWFQEAYRMTENELLIKYRDLATSLDRIENAIAEYKTALHMHSCAKEYLHNSKKPFENIDLLKHELVQTPLFL